MHRQPPSPPTHLPTWQANAPQYYRIDLNQVLSKQLAGKVGRVTTGQREGAAGLGTWHAT